MIKVKRNHVELAGTVADIGAEMAVLVDCIKRCLMEGGMPQAMAEKEIQRYVNIGFNASKEQEVSEEAKKAVEALMGEVFKKLLLEE